MIAAMAVGLLIGSGSICEDETAEELRARYREHAESLAPRAVEERLELARWAGDHGLLWEMRRELQKALTFEPDHSRARAMLGQVRIDGRWRDRADVESLRAEARSSRDERVRRWNRAARDLASASSERRDHALEELVRLAREVDRPQWEKIARHLHRRSTAAWTAWNGGRLRLEVRAQQAQLLGVDEFQTSLGTGAPVTLQLPRLRTISLGTTIELPRH